MFSQLRAYGKRRQVNVIASWFKTTTTKMCLQLITHDGMESGAQRSASISDVDRPSCTSSALNEVGSDHPWHVLEEDKEQLRHCCFGRRSNCVETFVMSNNWFRKPTDRSSRRGSNFRRTPVAIPSLHAQAPPPRSSNWSFTHCARAGISSLIPPSRRTLPHEPPQLTLSGDLWPQPTPSQQVDSKHALDLFKASPHLLV